MDIENVKSLTECLLPKRKLHQKEMTYMTLHQRAASEWISLATIRHETQIGAQI